VDSVSRCWHQDFRHRQQHERSPDILLHANVLGAFDHVHRGGIIRLSSVEGVLYGKLEPFKVTLKRNPRCQLLLKDRSDAKGYPREARDLGVAVSLRLRVSGFDGCGGEIQVCLFRPETLLRELSIGVSIRNTVEGLTVWLDDAVAQCVADPRCVCEEHSQVHARKYSIQHPTQSELESGMPALAFKAAVVTVDHRGALGGVDDGHFELAKRDASRSSGSVFDKGGEPRLLRSLSKLIRHRSSRYPSSISTARVKSQDRGDIPALLLSLKP
jgi:hypothetical protein